MPLQNVDNFWSTTDDENGDFYGKLINSSLKPRMMIRRSWSTLNGHILASDGVKNLFLPYKHFLNNMGKNGMGAELMVVVMVCWMKIKIFHERSGWSKQMVNFFTANTVAKYAMVDIATGASKVVKRRNPATTPGRWFNPLPSFGPSRLSPINSCDA